MSESSRVEKFKALAASYEFHRGFGVENPKTGNMTVDNSGQQWTTVEDSGLRMKRWGHPLTIRHSMHINACLPWEVGCTMSELSAGTPQQCAVRLQDTFTLDSGQALPNPLIHNAEAVQINTASARHGLQPRPPISANGAPMEQTPGDGHFFITKSW